MKYSINLLKIIAPIGGLLVLMNCNSMGIKDSSGNQNGISVVKLPGYTSEIKKISTLPAFMLDADKLDDKKDSIVSIYGGNVQAKIGEINGNSIEGGDAILAVVGRLRATAAFETAVKDLARNGSGASQNTLNFFSDLSEKTKVEGFALPVISSGFDSLKEGKKIDLKIYIFENTNKKVSLTAVYNGISASPAEIETSKKNVDQARSMMTATILKKVEELGSAIQKEIKGQAKQGESVASAVNPSVDDAIKAEPRQELTKRQKLITYLYAGAIFASWLIGYNLPF